MRLSIYHVGEEGNGGFAKDLEIISLNKKESC